VLFRSLLALVIPPLLPIAQKIQSPSGGYWSSAPNVSYFALAIFDAASGRLLYATDWFDTEKVIDQEGYQAVARDLLRPIVHVRSVAPPQRGEQPEGWQN
jgi:hypothetical protein